MDLKYNYNAIVFILMVINLSFLQQVRASHLHTFKSPETIDALDSVFFSLTQAQVTGSIVEIPVYIHSDDNIYTLDFSFKLDTNFLTYVNLIDHTGHIQRTEYFNNLDLKLRFTSNSFSKYPKGNSKVVSIRFKMKTNSVKKEYFSVIMTYLNGDQSSNRVKGNDIILNGVNDEPITNSAMQLWPNPGSDMIHVKNPDISEVKLTTIDGAALNQINIASKNSSEWIIDTSSLPAGYYIVTLKTKQNKEFYQKLILIK